MRRYTQLDVDVIIHIGYDEFTEVTELKIFAWDALKAKIWRWNVRNLQAFCSPPFHPSS